jgi:hypothetical protein
VNNLWDYRPHVWDYRESTWTMDRDLVGYDVEATDGSVGLVDHAAYDASGGGYLLIDISSWSSGKLRLIPAGVVTELDHGRRKVHLAISQSEVGDAPDYDRDRWDDEARARHDQYYGRRTGS